MPTEECVFVERLSCNAMAMWWGREWKDIFIGCLVNAANCSLFLRTANVSLFQRFKCYGSAFRVQEKNKRWFSLAVKKVISCETKAIRKLCSLTDQILVAKFSQTCEPVYYRNLEQDFSTRFSLNPTAPRGREIVIKKKVNFVDIVIFM